MTRQDTIDMIEARICSLPLADDVVAEIISLLDDPDSNFEQIVEKLSPEVCAKFLNMANSAYYGLHVRTVNHAVRVLGYSGMKQILMTSNLMDRFAKHSDLEGFNFDKFQKQALFSAAVSRVLGQILDYKKLEDLFTVAMLHNIGKLVIVVYFKDKHKEIKALKESEDILTREAERRVLGINHAEIGALVLKRFNISQDICDAIKLHHSPDHIISEDSNFQLELIARESSRIVDSFALPEEMEPLEIIDLLQGVIEEGRQICREELRAGVETGTYKTIFAELLRQASALVYRELKKHVQERGRAFHRML